MRFAWLKENSAEDDSIEQVSAYPATIIRKIYNAVFWIFLLPLLTLIEYRTGFIIFTINIFIRLSANLYVNIRDLGPNEFEQFPLRIS